MKKLSTYLFLILFSFSAPSFADDIRDFQIEDISVGDSLLDHFSKEEIENSLNYDNLPSDMKFRITEIVSSSFDLYNWVQFFHKPNDKNFIIYAIDGGVNYAQNINECYKKQLDIVNELSAIMTDAEFEGPTESIHTDDKSGKSTYTTFIFDFKTGESASVQCYDWSNEVDYVDHLRISISTEEVKNWIRSNFGMN